MRFAVASGTSRPSSAARVTLRPYPISPTGRVTRPDRPSRRRPHYGGQNTGPKDVPALSPGTAAVAFHGTGDVADACKDPEREVPLQHAAGFDVITRTPTRRREARSRRRARDNGGRGRGAAGGTPRTAARLGRRREPRARRRGRPRAGRAATGPAAAPGRRGLVAPTAAPRDAVS